MSGNHRVERVFAVDKTRVDYYTILELCPHLSRHVANSIEMAKSPTRARRKRAPLLTNNLKDFRIEEGIKRSVLAREAEVADKTVQRVESGDLSTRVTQYKLLNGLNVLRNKNRRPSDYTFKEVFPNHKGVTAR